MQNKKSKFGVIKVSIIMLVVAIGIVFAYFTLTKEKSNMSGEDTALPDTEVGKILAKDLELYYPSTPKEVVEFYSRISQRFYTKDTTEEQLKQLLEKMCLLFDEELLSQNPNESRLQQLKSEVNTYAAEKKTISSYQVQKNSDAIHSTKDGKEYAIIIAAYSIKQKGEFQKIYEKFILRKDKDKKWKILGWDLTGAIEIDE